jgi:hypothetical protein
MLDTPVQELSSDPRAERSACPHCALALAIVHARDGTTVSYDVDDWARLCACAEPDGPLTCPWVRRKLGAWLLPAVRPDC